MAALANRGSGYGKRRPARYPIKLPGGSTQRRVDDPQGVDQGDGSTSTAPDPAQPIDSGSRQPVGSTHNETLCRLAGVRTAARPRRAASCQKAPVTITPLRSPLRPSGSRRPTSRPGLENATAATVWTLGWLPLDRPAGPQDPQPGPSILGFSGCHDTRVHWFSAVCTGIGQEAGIEKKPEKAGVFAFSGVVRLLYEEGRSRTGGLKEDTEETKVIDASANIW